MAIKTKTPAGIRALVVGEIVGDVKIVADELRDNGFTIDNCRMININEYNSHIYDTVIYCDTMHAGASLQRLRELHPTSGFSAMIPGRRMDELKEFQAAGFENMTNKQAKWIIERMAGKYSAVGN